MLEEYQIQSRKTWRNVSCSQALDVYCLLGLTSEVGELTGKAKKIYRDQDGEVTDADRHAIALEIGDILWYLTQIATSLEMNMQEIASMNLQKLRDRQSRNAIGGNGDYR